MVETNFFVDETEYLLGKYFNIGNKIQVNLDFIIPMRRIIECVPNFSEGRRPEVIQAIANAISSVSGVKLLNIDSGFDANRTVYTIAGEPDSVVNAVFNAAKLASELIDMRSHFGKHPRIGALDVCPLIPISGITMDETVELARNLARKIGDELQIPVYCYENAAYQELRKDLSFCRKGEYEGLKKKMETPEGKPDFGPLIFNAKTGASVVGAREILIAYNVNLNSKNVEIANEIALNIREKGKIININGLKQRIPGSLHSVKAIGWFIEEYNCTQVSMNLTNYLKTPLHMAFDEVKTKAALLGAQVTGSEIIGMVPLKALLVAGEYFIKKQNLHNTFSQYEIINIAIETLGLSQFKPFIPKERIIEYLI